MFFKKHENNILKTNEQKIKEKALEYEKRKCPNCGNDPTGGKYHHGISLATCDMKYTYRTCSHCNCDYRY